MKYLFEKPLKEGIILKRNNQFTLDVKINGAIEKAHCPTTGRIGNIDLKNVECLLSDSTNPKRKTKYRNSHVRLSN